MYIKNLPSLITNINNVFKNSNIIKPSSALLKNEIYKELNKYSGNDWIKYTKINNKKINNINDLNSYNINNLNNLNNLRVNKVNNYNKELVYSNEIINIYLITWFPFSSSSIHGHGENGCLFKVLNGPLKETIYDKEYNIKKKIFIVMIK